MSFHKPDGLIHPMQVFFSLVWRGNSGVELIAENLIAGQVEFPEEWLSISRECKPPNPGKITSWMKSC